MIYILSAARSGSTLLEQLISERSGSVRVGEVRWIWERGLLNDARCDCGETVVSCPVWSHALERAFGTADAECWLEAARGHHETQSRLDHDLQWIRRSLVLRRARHDAAVTDYFRTLRLLYAGLDDVVAPAVLIDSSKAPGYLQLLEASGVEFTLRVHLTRDPVGVAASWRRSQPWSQPGSGVGRSSGPARSSVAWVIRNALAEAVGADVRVRYEDLVRAPDSVVTGVLEAGNVALTRPESVGGPRLGRAHAFSGNPMRFEDGSRTIRPDNRWKSELSPSDVRIVRALTWPGRRRYGYPGAISAR